MTVTRVTYSDLIMGFVLGTSTNPSTTTATNLILSLYKKVYQIWYGNLDYYETDDSNISDGCMNAVFPVVQSAASRILNQMHQSLKLDSQFQMPALDFTKDEVFQIAMIKPLQIRKSSREEITYYD